MNVPEKVLALAGSDELKLIWRNGLGGLTFRASGPDKSRYIKWQPLAQLSPETSPDVDLIAEAEKLQWARRFICVPQVLDHGKTDEFSWLVTEEIPSISAVDPQWKETPEVAVRAIAHGLRRLHDTLPVSKSPYRGTWYGNNAFPFLAPTDMVVCHGDPCVPNTLMSKSGSFVAHVDLGRLGVGDRWSDLAIATYSISWDINFGRSYDHIFFEAYGQVPDYERIRFYRNLWDAP